MATPENPAAAPAIEDSEVTTAADTIDAPAQGAPPIPPVAPEDVPLADEVPAAAQTVRDAKATYEHPDAANVGKLVSEVGALVPVAEGVVKETKAGWKTTEFWAGIASAIAAVATELPQTDKVALIGLSGLYAIARGIAKNGVPSFEGK